MTQRRIKHNIKELESKTRQYTPILEKDLAKTGKTANAAVIFSAAKYYEAILKLAKA